MKESIELFLSHQAEAAAEPMMAMHFHPLHELVVGEQVWYKKSDGMQQQAVVILIDRSMDPPQYGIELGTSSVIRYTEQSRLVPCAIPHSKPAGRCNPRWSASFSNHACDMNSQRYFGMHAGIDPYVYVP